MQIAKKVKLATSSIGSSRLRIEASIVIGFTNATSPRTIPILHIQLPTILPTASSLLFLKTADMLTKNSGEEVANAVTKSPTIKGLMPKIRAIDDEPLIKSSPPMDNMITPAINTKI